MIETYRSDEKADSAAGGASTRRNLDEGATQDDTRQQIGVRLAELRAMEVAYEVLESLDKGGQTRAFRWLAQALGVEALYPSMTPIEAVAVTESDASHIPQRGGKRQMNPRDFVSHKKPQSLVERVACLAYYLTHYRDTGHFKTADIVALNTEAAAHKFGNPSRDVDNADRQNGYIVSAGNGAKQLTVRGEAVVEALPDREAVKVALQEHAHKPKRSSSSAKKSASHAGDQQ